MPGLIITTTHYDFETVPIKGPEWFIIEPSVIGERPIAVVRATAVHVQIQSTEPDKLLALGQALIGAATELAARTQPLDAIPVKIPHRYKNREHKPDWCDRMVNGEPCGAPESDHATS